ncbi:hypothetical protein AAFF_G00206200 [Aldrovandia affinis]|uniref:Sushi domain-containing protein n=1 Tax=Aldrovandia affinis TaxID=143900 RepID=A0AAD7RI61_9TELE|nr:hypothetical protein AAFF_G00206200 [Aldrovandia affinis]
MDSPRMKSLAHRLIFFLLFPLSTNHDIVSAKEGCPPLPQKDNTKPFVQLPSYPEGYKFNYTCIDGYVRKAGTSNMTRCIKSIKLGSPLQWDNLSGRTAFVCIPDPRRKKTTKEGCPPLPQKDNTKPFVQLPSYPEGYKFNYTCIDGYVRKAGTSNMTRAQNNSNDKYKSDHEGNRRVSGTWDSPRHDSQTAQHDIARIPKTGPFHSTALNVHVFWCRQWTWSDPSRSCNSGRSCDATKVM